MRQLSRAGFTDRYRGSFERVFELPSDKPLPIWFANNQWDRMYLPHDCLFMDQITFEALKKAAIEAGDHELVITAAEIIPSYSESVELNWNFENLANLSAESILGHLECAMFGLSAKWGVIGTVDDLSVIAGEDRFMEAFYSIAGRRQDLLTAFLDYAEKDWFVDADFKDQVLKMLLR